MKTTVLIATLLLTSFTAMAENIDLGKSSFVWKGSKITGDFHTGPIKMKKAKLDNGKGYKKFKEDLAELVIERLRPIKDKYNSENM